MIKTSCCFATPWNYALIINALQQKKLGFTPKRDKEFYDSIRGGFLMSFLGIPNERERRLAHDEAAEAIDKHGDQAAAILLMKAQQSRSPQRRAVYRFARRIVLGQI